MRIKNSHIEIDNNYYQSKMMNKNIVIYNRFYHRKKGAFLLYLLLEILGGPSFGWLQMPRKFVIGKNAKVIKLSKDLHLETDGAYQLLFETREVRRWFFGVVFPIFIVSLIFLFMLYQTIRFMILSNMSLVSIVLFTVLLFVNIFLLWIHAVFIENYRDYRKVMIASH